MEEGRGTDFGFVGGALERTKAYHNSNVLANYNGILVPDTQRTLKNFGEREGFGLGIDQDTLADDKLLKCTVHKMIPTRKLSEFENPAQIYLITDAKGFDIGTYDASTKTFTLSPDIAKVNSKMLESIPGSDMIKKDFTEPSFKDVMERISKGESLVLTSKEQATTEIVKATQKSFSKAGQEFDIDESGEQSEEQKAMDSLPDGAKSEVMKIKEMLPEGAQIKDILVVNSPSSLADDMSKDAGIRENGGPVIVVRTVNKEGLGGKDDVYMFQDETQLPNVAESRDDILEVMDQHKGEGVVDDFKDTEKEQIIDRIEEQIYLTEDKVRKLEEIEFDPPEDRNKAIAAEYEDLGNKIESTRDYFDREQDADLLAIQDKVDEQAKDAENGEHDEQDNDDMELSRWDTANPYMHK